MKIGPLVSASLMVWIPLACGTTGSDNPQENGHRESDQPSAPHSSEPVLTQTEGKPCRGLECQQVSCSTGTTTVSGTVFAPNGKLPLYNAVVYVPNDPLPELPQGVTCDKCGTPVGGSPVVLALSDAAGKFTLSHVPVGMQIPLVIQMGKWRRKVTLPEVKRCVDNPIADHELTRLPKNQREGNMPHIAVTTGLCDSLGCMLPKIGIDASEFGVASDGVAKAVHVYKGMDAKGPTGATLARNFWNDFEKLKAYDMAIFACECLEAPSTKGSYGGAAYKAVTDYLAAGGRIYTTDYQYVWYRNSPDKNLGRLTPSNAKNTGIGVINGDAPNGGSPITLDTSFPKGKALADWLQTTFPDSAYGKVTPDVVFDNIGSIEKTKAQVWATSPYAGYPRQPGDRPRIFTVNTPVGKPAAEQCGKGVHIDAHVNMPQLNVGDTVEEQYPATCAAPLKQAEAMFAFFFFDLAACVQKEDTAPAPPPPR